MEVEQPGASGPFRWSHPERRMEQVRLVWKLLLFLALTIGIGQGLVYREGARLFGVQRGITSPQFLLFFEAGNFALVFGLTWLLSLAEKRPLGEYGLPLKEAFRGNFWIGFLLGMSEASVVVGLVAIFGGYSFGELAERGDDILKWG